MKRNKLSLITILALSGLMASGPIARSQTTNTPATPAVRAPRAGGAAAKALQTALDKLDLSADQKSKVTAAITEQRTKTIALRGDTSIAAKEKRAKVKEIADAFDASLKSIFTADQYKKWLEVKPQTAAAGRRAGRAGGAGAGTPPTGGAPAP